MEVKDNAVLSERITTLFADTLSSLLKRRDEQYRAAVEPLENEKEALLQESAAITEAVRTLADVLPAQGREVQRQADVLTLAGKHEEGQVKLAEIAEIEQVPVAMEQRSREIRERVETIDREKKAIAKRIFEQWYGEVQSVVQASERGFFLTLLDSLKNSFYEFQSSTGTEGGSAPSDRPLLRQYYFENLTSDVRSPEWLRGNFWYGGRP
jgi:hypothetical protein